MFSSLPKLHLGRSSSEVLSPPPFIYCITNRDQIATFAAKQRTFWWRSSTGGNMLSNSPCNTLLVRVHYETWSMDRSLDLIMDSITLFKFWVKIDVHTNQQQCCDVMCMLSIMLTGIVIQLYLRCVGYCKYPQYIHLSTHLFMYQFTPRM